jgi:hypothetical protein
MEYEEKQGKNNSRSYKYNPNEEPPIRNKSSYQRLIHFIGIGSKSILLFSLIAYGMLSVFARR